MVRFLVLAFMLCTCVALPAATSSRAAETPSGDAVEVLRRINIAGRQRMLSQRIVLKACLTRAGGEATRNRAEGLAAIDLFDRSLRGLIHGDGDLRLSAETDPQLRAALGRVMTLWPGFAARSRLALGDGARADAALTGLPPMAETLLSEMNAAVTMMEHRQGAGLLAPETARAVNIAGRQRMLIQKAAGRACLAVTQGAEAAASGGMLSAATRLFERSLADLLTGAAESGVPPPPSAEVELALIRVVRIWKWLVRDLDAADAGATLPIDRLALMGRTADVVLAQMNITVGLYEGG